MKKSVKIVIGVAAVVSPAFAFAASAFQGIADWLSSFGSLVTVAIPILFSLAFLAFFYGVVKFIFSAGDEEARKKGTSIMIWGVVAIFVMSSVWGIVAWLRGQIGITSGDSGTGVYVPSLHVQ